MECTSRIISLVALSCSAVFALTIARSADIQFMSMLKEGTLKIKDSGHADNCGSVPINFTWSPKDLSPSGEVTLYLDYILPYDLNKGTYNLTIYEHGEMKPMINNNGSFTCNTLHHCPLNKGDHVVKSQVISNLRNLGGYAGDYDVVAQVWNSDLQNMFCINFTLTILDELGPLPIRDGFS
ncbi:hypothetical protein BgiBS90_031643 [Biomphalaria glabrata]|nr:hypothetical protein BgiBS90_031643 [Biomphalaria glabrata]